MKVVPFSPYVRMCPNSGIEKSQGMTTSLGGDTCKPMFIEKSFCPNIFSQHSSLVKQQMQ